MAADISKAPASMVRLLAHFCYIPKQGWRSANEPMAWRPFGLSNAPPKAPSSGGRLWNAFGAPGHATDAGSGSTACCSASSTQVHQYCVHGSASANVVPLESATQDLCQVQGRKSPRIQPRDLRTHVCAKSRPASTGVLIESPKPVPTPGAHTPSIHWVRAVHIHRVGEFFLQTQRTTPLSPSSPRPCIYRDGRASVDPWAQVLQRSRTARLKHCPGAPQIHPHHQH